ncbi:MAG: thymidine phosphorylase [Bacilli bacterium]|jgi:pyrimidine-nucleoside phosphorylase|nr:thymidine phosphorylase [Bacilli bacterium]
MIITIIDKKRRRKRLTREDLAYVVSGFLDGTIPDYQMASLLMAITIHGMTTEEACDLTDVMLHSGERIDLSAIPGIKVDKHSTGGIGDKTTIILAPLVASLGIPVAKMSGRGLGLTGGTIDKLEAIPGFRVSLSETEFVNQVTEIGLAITGGTKNLVPADKAIYALRDVTGTVASIPLIASSIMSKKLASGADKIVIDLKVGKGALMPNRIEAEKLAYLMTRIGKQYGKDTVCILTDMDEPLGCKIGNALEIQECMEVLQGGGPKDIKDLVLYLAMYMIHMGTGMSYEEARIAAIEQLSNGEAYAKFEEMVACQGGDLSRLTVAPKVFSIKSTKTGFITAIDAYKIGAVVHKIGAGRSNKEDQIDYGVGVELTKKTGEFVTEGEELVKVYLHEHDLAMQEILDCFTITEHAPTLHPLIYGVIESD